MITAETARSITNASIVALKDSPLFKYAIDLIERYIRDASSRGRAEAFLSMPIH